MSYKSNIYDIFILYNEIFFYIYNFFVETKNNNLNFDQLINNYDAINHISSPDIYKKFSNIRDFLPFYYINEYYIYLDFYKLINFAINIFFYLLLAEFIEPNWHISFINIIEKSLL